MTSSPIRACSFAKVNLALSVLGRRSDGFHEIHTILQTIDLYDELEFRAASELRLECQGLEAVHFKDNLVWKAAQMLAEAASESRGADIFVRKHIPAGSGLGGGSSNAATTLLALCRLWRLEIPPGRLQAMARGLGSDVPYFLQGGLALGIGRGDEIYPLPDLPTAHMVVIFPGVPVSTQEAYESLSLVLTSEDKLNKIKRLCGQTREGLSSLAQIFNDFERSILPAYPAIKEAKDFLCRRGATATLLSGSGSSVFGFFHDEESALAASRTALRETWRVFPAKTLSRAEYIQRMFG